jgi:broad specificity phosphatase PhoE
MGWVRHPPSVSARDVAVVPCGATKTIYLIRHAEGFHNQAGERDPKEYGNEAYADARLTEKGWRQCEAFKANLKLRGDAYEALVRKCELVVVSPLSRAMDTAAAMFGVEDGDARGGEVLMRGTEAVAMKTCARPTLRLNTALCGGAKFVALESCREQIGGNPCDRRRSVTEYKKEYPGVDFSLIENDTDVFWKPGHENREPEPVLRARAREFLDWCMKRDEDHIIVVTHSAFMCNLMVEYALGGANPCKTMVDHLHRWPANCECRPLVIIDQKNQFNHSPFYHPGGDLIEE